MRRLGLYLLSVLLGTICGIVTFTGTAHAADECGTDWHKESDGLLSGNRTGSQDGRSSISRIDGYVRYCTRDRGFGRPDQKNQKILLGVPETIVNYGTWVGAFSSRCLRQEVKIVFANQGNLSDVVIGGDGGLHFDFGNNAITFSRKRCTSDNTAKLTEVGLVLTASNQTGCLPSTPGSGMWIYCLTMAPKVASITVDTTTIGEYGSGNTLRVTHTETDTSASTRLQHRSSRLRSQS